MVRASAHGAMGRQIDPSWWTHSVILVPAVVCAVVLCWYVLVCCGSISKMTYWDVTISSGDGYSATT